MTAVAFSLSPKCAWLNIAEAVRAEKL